MTNSKRSKLIGTFVITWSPRSVRGMRHAEPEADCAW
jgi:hypothetical protein